MIDNVLEKKKLFRSTKLIFLLFTEFRRSRHKVWILLTETIDLYLEKQRVIFKQFKVLEMDIVI